ncbi:hypothetical protein [Neomicrococcus lactis]|uniref:hypothetical protein n=1 Tax=Neomicrococcus lactis TaxID=732241 RepID=UPI002300AB49|nr:hypothetical protein [Neomicrococcus lactis]
MTLNIARVTGAVSATLVLLLLTSCSSSSANLATAKKEVDGGMQALISGELVLRGDQCIVLERANNAGTTALLWPHGTTVTTSSNGKQEVHYGGGVVATLGSMAQLAGGYAAKTPEDADVDSPKCLTGAADQAVWVVNLSK